MTCGYVSTELALLHCCKAAMKEAMQQRNGSVRTCPDRLGGVPVAQLVRLGTRIPRQLARRLHIAAELDGLTLQERLWAALDRDLPALAQLQQQLGTEGEQE
jgi:hypothetical protein